MTISDIIIEALEYRRELDLMTAEQWCALTRLLAKLEPSKCEDGSIGYVAYNVGDRRMKMKTGRFLTRKLGLLDLGVKESYVQTIAESINLLLNDPVVRFDSGQDIVKNYANGVGGHSCMTGDNACCTGMYAANPDRYCQMVMTAGKISARAMVVRTDEGYIYMDRVYSDSEVLEDKMYEYARKRGWLTYKDRPRHMSVSGVRYEAGEVPYQDTFHYGDVVGDCLNLSTNQGSIDLRVQDGYIGNGNVCPICGDRYPYEEMYYTEDGDVCRRCLERYYAICDGCEKVFPIEDIRYVDGEGDFCTECVERFEVCSRCGEYTGDPTYPTSEGVVCCRCVEGHTKCGGCGYYHDEDEVTDGRCAECAEKEMANG